MNTTTKLNSFHIIQKGCNNEDSIIWTFPSISAEQKSVVLRKAFMSQEQNLFRYLRFQEWFYICQFETGGKRMALCLICTDYDPNKYETLCDILVKKYQKTEDAVELVKLYLTVFTQGFLSIQENGTLVTYNFRQFSSVTNIKELIKAFGLEIILIYTALLLKKRILVFHQNLRNLQNVLLSISKLMPHRNPNDYLYPQIDDILDARGKMFFMTGTTNSKPTLSTEFYDLYVNFVSHKISIAPQARETFTMTKMHKDLATFLVQLAENMETTEEQIIIEINSKTQELLTNLKSLATVTTAEDKQVITLENLRAKRLNPTTENFLFNLAVAENMMML